MSAATIQAELEAAHIQYQLAIEDLLLTVLRHAVIAEAGTFRLSDAQAAELFKPRLGETVGDVANRAASALYRRAQGAPLDVQ